MDSKSNSSELLINSQSNHSKKTDPVMQSEQSESISKQLQNIGTRTFDRLYSFDDESSKESYKPTTFAINPYERPSGNTLTPNSQSSVARGIRKAPEITVLDSDGSVNGVSRKCEESPMGSDLLKLQPVTMNIIDDKLATNSNNKSSYLIDEKSKHES